MPLVTDATRNDLTYKIIGAAMTVHNEIGYGFKEVVYCDVILSVSEETLRLS